MEQRDSEFIIFKTKHEKTSVDVHVSEQDVWLTQDQLALLFGVERLSITQCLNNIFRQGESNEKSVSKKFLRTVADVKNTEKTLEKKTMTNTLNEQIGANI